tara:strand:- start:138 stop:479 length:342 start_codon:yes stop_codon:yes gene_type:complete
MSEYLFDLLNPSPIDAPSPDNTYTSGTTRETRATSDAARVSLRGRAGTMRRAVYEIIKRDGPLDDKAIQALLGMGGSTERPRRRELQQAGLIEAAPGAGRTVRWRVRADYPTR